LPTAAGGAAARPAMQRYLGRLPPLILC